MVKVISFCFWGDEKKYTIGALRNAELSKTFYPDFECWFYIHIQSVPEDIIYELSKLSNVKLIYKTGDVSKCRPMMWRFESIIEKDVELMMPRDTDTRILLREKLAVDEWLNSDKLIHIMRDHPYHNYNIQGGMWGIKKNNLCDWGKLMDDVIQLWDRMYDQLFVSDVIYPIYKNYSIIHASNHRREEFAIDFPIPFCIDKKRVGEYVYEDESRVKEQYDDVL